MRDVFISIVGVMLYASGLLVWPACVLLWRRTRRPARAARFVFMLTGVCQLTLLGFFVFSENLLEHQYYWLMMMVIANLFFTPLALVAVLLDYGASRNEIG